MNHSAGGMKALTRLFRTIHGLMAFLFACGALILIIIAARMGWLAFVDGLDRAAAQGIIEAIGLLAAAVVALQIAETIFEEEVIRDADISAPTRVRRFPSRFFVVVVSRWPSKGLLPRSEPCTKIRRNSPLCREYPCRGRRAPCRLGCIRSPQSLRRGTGTGGNGGRKARRPKAQVIDQIRA